MTKQEEEFFEFYDKVSDYAESNGIPTHQVVSIRQVWDYAYACGKAAGSQEMLEVFKESTNG